MGRDKDLLFRDGHQKRSESKSMKIDFGLNVEGNLMRISGKIPVHVRQRLNGCSR